MERRRALRPALAPVLLCCLLRPSFGFLVPSPQQQRGLTQRTTGQLSPVTPAGYDRSEVMALFAKKKKGSSGSTKSVKEQETEGGATEFPAIITEEEEAAIAAEDEATKDGLSPTMYDKLRSEATTPFRAFRMFVYAGFGIGASLGGFTAITELIAALNHVANAIPLEKAAVNVGVDLAVAAAAGYAWVFENNLKKQAEKDMAALRAKEPFRLTFDLKEEREKMLSALPVSFTVGENQTLTWSVKEVRERGNQHLIVLAAPRQQLSDALLGARIAKALFAKNDVMIAPYVLRDEKEEALESAMGKKGFGKAPVSFEAIFDKENYVARPADEEAWKAYVDQELSDALKQGNGDAAKKGIGVVMRKDGTIIRRGLGQPEWRDVVAELSGAQQPGENDDNYIPLMPTQPAAASKKKK